MYRVTQYDINQLRERLKHVPEADPLMNYLDGFVDNIFYDGYGELMEHIVTFLNTLDLQEVYNNGYQDGVAFADDTSIQEWDTGFADGFIQGYDDGYSHGHDDGYDLAKAIYEISED